MRTLLAIALILGSVLALPSAADARRAVHRAPAYAAHPRYYQPRYRYARPRYYGPRYYYGAPAYSYRPPRYYSRERQVCEERAQAEDPTGLYAGYPCWAREAFGRTPGGHR